jgi:hypothetical protein
MLPAAALDSHQYQLQHCKHASKRSGHARRWHHKLAQQAVLDTSKCMLSEHSRHGNPMPSFSMMAPCFRCSTQGGVAAASAGLDAHASTDKQEQAACRFYIMLRISAGSVWPSNHTHGRVQAVAGSSAEHLKVLRCGPITTLMVAGRLWLGSPAGALEVPSCCRPFNSCCTP